MRSTRRNRLTMRNFVGASSCSFMTTVWKTWEPPKCSFFVWLAVQNNLWTSDRLAIRGWSHQPSFQLCRCHPETTRHILFECRYSRRIWTDAASRLHCPYSCKDLGQSCQLFTASGRLWLPRRPHPSHKGVKTVIILIPSEIRKERNGRIFNNKSSMSSLLFQGIKDEAKVGSSLELRNWEKVSNAFF